MSMSIETCFICQEVNGNNLVEARSTLLFGKLSLHGIPTCMSSILQEYMLAASNQADMKPPP